MFDGMLWLAVKDGDARAFDLMRRHYSFHRYADGRRDNRNNPNRHLICGPGEKMVLITLEANALFVWRKFIDDNGQTGINCAVFRNESAHKSSDMIREAEQLAWQRWPGERLYTYVDARKIKSTNPGFCFQAAGWRKIGITKSGKVILAKPN